MKKYIYFSMLLLCSNVYAWENKVTHRDISNAAAKLSLTDEQRNSEYELNGEKKPLLDWVKDGAELEDAGSNFALSKARFKNHFHNPLAILTPPIGTLTDGGLKDIMTGQSTLFWAQDSSNQVNYEGGDWSWNTVRSHYYRSLTETDKAKKDEFTVKTYLGLGYQMHLLQDMGQPDHVRNDAHPIDGSGFLWGFETWARKKRPFIQQQAATATNATKPTVDLTQPLFEGYAPVGRLMDTRRYVADRTPSSATNQGLAEYTNSNFFSDDTIFAARYSIDDKHYFPYPRKEGTDIQKYFDGTKAPETVLSEDNKSVKGLWISKVGEGEIVPHLVRVGAAAELAYAVFGEGKLFYAALGRDEITYEDYASLLVPKAVGYSAALLDHFFRGKIKLTVATPENITFRSIKVRAENDLIGETMGVGEAKLVIRYKALSEWPAMFNKYKLNYPPEDSSPDKYTYKVSIPQYVDLTNPQTLTFDFSTDALPYFFNDMTMQLVFKGKLGNEEGAVAVSQLEPINEVFSDFTVSLPASGVYAKATNNTLSTLSTTFNEVRVKAQTDIPAGLTGGSFELALEYRKASTDQFQSLTVDTEPADAEAYVIRVPEKNGVSILQPGTPVELVFDISSVLLPVSATDIDLNIIYKSSSTSKNVAIGYSDISEPTPVDVFNNTDKVCINQQWYVAGSSEAIAAVGTDSFGIPLGDVFPHSISNIYYKAGAAGSTSLNATQANNNLMSAVAVEPGHMQRLGYILTDYQFGYTTDEQVTDLDSRDDWTLSFDNTVLPGTGFPNQYDKGFGGMYTIRGQKMWWGAGVIYDNETYPVGSPDCSWDTLQ
jgi:hypothetical protein